MRSCVLSQYYRVAGGRGRSKVQAIRGPKAALGCRLHLSVLLPSFFPTGSFLPSLPPQPPPHGCCSLFPPFMLCRPNSGSLIGLARVGRAFCSRPPYRVALGQACLCRPPLPRPSAEGSSFPGTDRLGEAGPLHVPYLHGQCRGRGKCACP